MSFLEISIPTPYLTRTASPAALASSVNSAFLADINLNSAPKTVDKFEDLLSSWDRSPDGSFVDVDVAFMGILLIWGEHRTTRFIERLAEFQSDAIVKEALLDKERDLSEYAKKIHLDLAELEHTHVLDYAAKTPAFIDLHSHISSCDQMLENMEHHLNAFQSELSKISSEIETLQKRSLDINVRLSNRQAVQRSLNQTLEGLVISQDMIKKIFEGEVNEFFIEHLTELNAKMSYVKANQGRNIRAFKLVGPELERLRIKAAEKIREFLIKKIDSLRVPGTNIPFIQQSVLLKYKELYYFLLERHIEVASEMRINYISIQSFYYLQAFDRYCKAVIKFQGQVADKYDLIGSEENPKRGLFGVRQNVKDKQNVYNIGDRIQTLANPESGIIIPTSIEEGQGKFPFEVIFKSITRLVMDNAGSEYIFDNEFFVCGRLTQSRLDAASSHSVFSEIFDGTLKYLQAFIRQCLESSVDVIGILLCLRINRQNMRIMKNRELRCIDNFMQAMNLWLWPKFQAVLDMHVESLRKAPMVKLTASKDLQPHFITRRYAELAASVLILNQGYEDDAVLKGLARLRSEVEVLISKIGAELKNTKQELIFLINNYDMVGNILGEYKVSSFEQETAYFSEMLYVKIDGYVEEELRPKFGNFTQFVNQVEKEDLATVTEERFETMANEFNGGWKGALSNLNTSILQSFPNFKNGAKILHVALTQLLLIYKRFMTLFDTKFQRKRSKVSPVSLQVVMMEMKRFKTVF